jgi:hypothetical protein
VNCGEAPTTSHPNGWLKRIDSNGAPSANFEANLAYCSLFGSQIARSQGGHAQARRRD